MADPDAFRAIARGGLAHARLDEETAQRAFGRTDAHFIFKSIAIRRYSVDWDVGSFARTYSQLLTRVSDGSLKIQVSEYALKDAAKAHRAVSNRTTVGKVVLVP